MDGKTLYIFIDESGNFDFSEKGTKHFVLTAVSTLKPLHSIEKLFSLRYDFLRKGMDIEYFHATEDRQSVRDAVFESLQETNDFEIDSIIVQKNRVAPDLYTKCDTSVLRHSKPIRSEERLYKRVSQSLLEHIFSRYHPEERVGGIVVVLGAIFTRPRREYILKGLKSYLKNHFDKRFFIYFQSVSSDINCQIADYCGWALYVQYERGEKRPLEKIQSKIRSCSEMFRESSQEYY